MQKKGGRGEVEKQGLGKKENMKGKVQKIIRVAEKSQTHFGGESAPQSKNLAIVSAFSAILGGEL